VRHRTPELTGRRMKRRSVFFPFFGALMTTCHHCQTGFTSKRSILPLAGQSNRRSMLTAKGAVTMDRITKSVLDVFSKENGIQQLLKIQGSSISLRI
jgi:hypothetical protein